MSRQPGTATLEKIKNRSEIIKKQSIFNVNTASSIERTRRQSYINRQNREENSENVSEFLGRIDDYEGLFTTQQLESVDFSEFKNHVFFDSAVSKVHYSYDKILNEFPYDKSEYYFKQYFNSLDGFTKYVYDNFIPKNKGYLKLDGENTVVVNDVTGNILEDYENDKKLGLIDINNAKFSFDFWIYINSVNSNMQLGKQIVFQKLYNNNGITIYLDNFYEDQVLNKKFCKINVLITHDKNYHICTGDVPLSKFSHINFSFFNAKGKKHCKFYLNGIRTSSNNSGNLSKNTTFSENFKKSVFFIGNGNNHIVTRDNNLSVIKDSGLKGYIDEFRFFVAPRSDKEIFEGKNININAQAGLNIYYTFNEPSSEYANNHIVLDNSGHKTHGKIKKFSDLNLLYTLSEIKDFRAKQENINTPIIYEKDDNNPVLFPRFGNILDNQEILLKKARKYDNVNPNIFYKFFPKNLFVEDSDFSGNNDIFVTKERISTVTGKEIDLLEVKNPESSLLIKLITTWARFFDQLKCYIDQISSILQVNYDDLNKNKNHTSIILPYAVSQLGFKFEEIFPSPILEKLNSKNLEYDELINESSIRQIQNNLWKRFLINSQDYLTSKGTINSIKSVFNSFGLDPDLFVNIREFNSQNKLNMYHGFKEKLTSLKHIDFFENKVMLSPTVFVGSQPTNRVYLESNLSNEQNVLDLSENWSVETFVKFDHLKKLNYNNKQSLFRIDIEQTSSNVFTPYINVIFEREKNSSSKGKLKLFVNEVNLNTEIKSAEIDDVNLLSGKIYYLCVTKRNKSIDCSEYKIEIVNSDLNSRLQPIRGEFCKVNIINKSVDLSNYRLRVGPLDMYDSNDINSLSNMDFHSDFEGKIIGLRVWSKVLSSKEKNIHKTDIFCHGTHNENNENIFKSLSDLKVNINFKESYDNIDTSAGFVTIYNDVLGNNNVENRVYFPNTFTKFDFIKTMDYVILEQSNSVDYPENYNRVNINSLQDKSLSKEFNNYLVNPSYEVDIDFSKYEDIRLSIDFSSSNFINKEISKLILVGDFFTQSLANRSNLYEPEYQSLYELRNVFYDKLEKEINIKQLYQVYKYFDNILENLLHDAVPSKVNYQGFNFVYESSIAERHKYQYKMSESRFPVIDLDINYSRYNLRHFEKVYWQETDIRSDIFDRSSNSNSKFIKTPFK